MYIKQKGQTLIETAFILILILVILLGITEFSRAWFLKSSLKNAVRHGARVAVVTPGLVNQSGNCPGTGIIAQVCSQPGVPATNTSVTLTIADTSSPGGLSSGDTVTVTAVYNNPNFFIVGGEFINFMKIRLWPWERSLNITVDASMRYE